MLAPHNHVAVSEVRDSIVGCVPHLRAFARSLCGNRDKADDLVQEAIARALAAERSYTPGTNFKAWIFTILRNLYFNDIRKHRGRMVSCDNLGEYEPSCPPTHHAALEFCDLRRDSRCQLQHRLLADRGGFLREMAERGVAFQLYRAIVRGVESENEVEQGGLAGAVGADESDAVAAVYLQRCILEENARAEGFGHAGDS